MFWLIIRNSLVAYRKQLKIQIKVKFIKKRYNAPLNMEQL